MKLPDIQLGGVESLGRVPDKSAEIRYAANQFAQGMQDISRVTTALEVQRKDQQAEDAAHEYDINSLNFDADHFSRTQYASNDPVLEGLDIKTTQTELIDGVETDVPRSNIPADEVWPKLFMRNRQEMIKSQAAKIESPARRSDFTQKATEQAQQDMVRMIERTTAAQEARRVETTKWQVNQLREIGTPAAWAKIDDKIAALPNTEERRELSQWAGTTRVKDSNTEVITGGIQDRDTEVLAEGYDAYLGYARDAENYNGPLTQAELYTEANRYKQALNQVNTMNTADSKVFLGELKYNVDQSTANNNNGYPASTEGDTQLKLDMQMVRDLKPDDETLYKKQREHNESIEVRDGFRNVITDIPEGGTVYDAIANWREQTNSSTMTDTDRDIADRIDGLTKSFVTQMNSNPMGTLQTYGLAVNPEAPIEDINFGDVENVSDALAQREFSYDYYKGVYGFTGDLLTPNERSQFNGVLENEAMLPQEKIQYMFEVADGTSKYEEKFWGPSINDKAAGKYAALGQLMVDYNTIGQQNGGLNIATKIYQGLEQYKAEPELLEDYFDARSELRQKFGASYSQFGDVRDSYMDLAVAHAIATSSNSKYISTTALKQSMDTVTGGMISSGKGMFLSPQAGMKQPQWDEWLHTYDPQNLGTMVQGYDKHYIMEQLRENNWTLQPSGANRREFFIITGNGSLTDHKTRQPYRFNYDPNAPKRLTKTR